MTLLDGFKAISYGDGGKLRDIVAKEMTPSQLEKAQDLARECVRKKYKGCWVELHPRQNCQQKPNLQME